MDHSEASSMSAEEKRRVEEDRMIECQKPRTAAERWRERFNTEQALRLKYEDRLHFIAEDAGLRIEEAQAIARDAVNVNPTRKKQPE